MPQENQNEELRAQFEELNSIRQPKHVFATWFHPNFTGRGNTRAGHFKIDNALLNDYLCGEIRHAYHEVRGVFSTPYYSATRDEEHAYDMDSNQYHIPGQYIKSGDFLLSSVIPQFVQYAHISMCQNAYVELTFPLSSTLYDVNNDDDTFIDMYDDVNSGMELLGKVVYQELSSYAKVIPSATGQGSTVTRTYAPLPYLQLLIRPKTANNETMVHVINDDNLNEQLQTNTAYLLTIPLGIEATRTNGNGAPNLRVKTYGTHDTITRFITSKGFELADDEINDLVNDIISQSSIPITLAKQANHIVKHYLDDTLTFLQACIDAIIKIKNNPAEHEVGRRTQDTSINNIIDQMARHVKYMDKLREYDESLIKTSHLQRIFGLLSDNIDILGGPAISHIAKQSLQLLLSQRLHDINALHQVDALYKIENIDEDILNEFLNSDEYSDQQKQIITTTEPLVIGQAGAGTGKSHTLIGRIKYLEAQGVDLSKILVLSFTNIAAENIVNRFAGIKSETLANMFNRIYSANYPTQTLSEPTTLANAIRLLSPQANIFREYNATFVERFLRQFASALSNFDQRGFKKVDLQLTTKTVATMIETNLELTEIVLNAIEQTTLELQPIIIHTRMMSDTNSIQIPPDYQNIDFIITDESQDTSTFEYVLLLELVLHHKSQLLIVGDGSQNLYEFRNSNPRYLNALEASNVFTSYKLDVNYRSNDEILCFANQFLQVIEANAFATIQLQSDQETRASVDSFKDAVKIKNVSIRSVDRTHLREGIEDFLQGNENFRSWLREKLESGEQVALLAATRDEVSVAEEILNEFLDELDIEERVVNILQNNERPDTIISDILMKSHRQLKDRNVHQLRDSDGMRNRYENELLNVMQENVESKYRFASDAQKEYFKSIIEKALKKITHNAKYRTIRQDVIVNNKPSYVLLGFISRELIRYETAKNAIENSIKRTREIPDYENAKIVVSTIHGSKGLEFDNTIVLFNESRNNATSQESFRALFVALSRAKSAEYILNIRARDRNLADEEDVCSISNMFIAPMQTAYARALSLLEQQEE